MRRVVLIAGLLLVLLAVLYLWLFAAATTPEALRLRLAETTGARVELEAVERLWWGPGAAIERLKLESSAYVLEVARLEVRVAFLPLLLGRVQPVRLDLSQARLSLTEGPRSGAPALPADAAWEVRDLEIWASVDGQPRQIFYLAQGSLSLRAGRPSRLEVVGGATAEDPAAVHIEGEAGAWRPPAFPDAQLRMRIQKLPAQPLLGYLFGDQHLLATARVDAALSLDSEKERWNAEGIVRAVTPAQEDLLAVQFRSEATATLFTLSLLTGQLAGNRIEASGQSRVEEAGKRRTELEFRLPDARLDNDTLRLLHAALGREVLGMADNLRGPFSAQGSLLATNGRETLTGAVELKGMTYAREGLPPLEDIRGRLRLDGPRVEFTGVTGRLFDLPVHLAGEVRGEDLALQLETDDVPLATLPWPLEESAPVGNLLGALRVRMSIDGQVYAPAISGVASLVEAGFDFKDVEVRGLEGEADFDPQQVRFDSIRGRAGDCAFELSGDFEVAQWRETATVHLTAPVCELGELVRLAERGGLGSWPLVKAETLAGTGALTADYENQRWRAELEIEDARWSPAWLALPMEGINARIGVDADGVELRRLTGRVGRSPVSVNGRLNLSDADSPSWELAGEARLEPQDAERLLHRGGPQWFHFADPVAGTARLVGSARTSTRVEARVQTPLHVHEQQQEGEEKEKLTTPAVLPQIELAGTWEGGQFEFERFTANIGSVEVQAGGSVRLSPEKYLDLSLTVPPGSSLADLLAFVRLPQWLSSLRGTVAAEVAVQGSPEALDWKGTIDLEEARVPTLLTEPVFFKGPIELGREGFYLRDLQVVQPTGTFALAGWVRPRGASQLRLTGAWANLDRLLGQLPEGPVSLRQTQFLARHPFRVTLTVDRVQFLGLVLTQVEGELEQKEGVLALRVPTFGVGAGQGRVEMKPDPAADYVSARLELDEVPLETLLVDLLKQAPTVRAPFSLQAQLAGPLGTRNEFLRSAEGRISFALGQGRIQRGTLPERLFALAVLLREGLYGFGLVSLGRSLTSPQDLRRFSEWTGAVLVGDGKAQVVESHLVAKAYDVTMTAEVNLESGAFQLHGDGNFHPGWQFDISLKNIVNTFARLLRLARGKRGHRFEFDVGGNIGGRKSVENFRFLD
jgi:hypothetical protein